MLALLLAILLLAGPAWAQPELRSGGVGASVAKPISATIIGADTNALDVNCVQGCAAGSGLTDAELRATAVPVDGSGVTQPVSGTFWQATQPVSGTVTANAGTGNFTVVQGTGTNLHIVCDSGCGGAASFTDEAAFTITTTPINIVGYLVDEAATDSAPENSAAAARMSPNRVAYSILRDAAGNERGANVTAGNALTVDGSAVTQPVSGTFWQATQPVSGTFWQATQPVSAAALPLPAGASTSALQGGGLPLALGAGGGLKVDGSGTALPVSGTFWQATQPVSGTVTATATDLDIRNLAHTQDSVRIGDGVDLALVSAGGALLVDGSATTQPVSGTFWQATQPVSGTFWQATQPVSGTVAVSSAPTTAVTGTFWQATQPISGNVGVLPLTTGGTSLFRLVAAGTTNATNVKASAGQVYSIQASNVNAAARFIHVYNTAGAPTCNASIIATYVVPGGSTGTGTNIPLMGAAFATGIGICITTANDGTGAVTASDVVLMVEYK